MNKKQIDLSLLPVFEKHKLQIIFALFNCQSNLCGCDLLKNLKIRKNLLSYHIKQLREMGFVEETKCGVKKQYKLNISNIKKVKKILEIFN